MIQHFLPRVIELPLVAVAHEALLGQGDRFLGRRVDLARALELDGRRLALRLGRFGLLERLVVRSRLVDAAAELLGGQFEPPGGLVHQDPEGGFGLLRKEKKS